jgi:uncharacterized membrane protein
MTLSSPAPSTAPAPACRRWLAASLALNLFLACAIGAAAWRWLDQRSEAAATAPAAAAAQRGLRFAADELPMEQRRAYRLGLRDARREMAPQVQTAREGRSEVLQLLTATRYDRQAVEQALARTREADLALRARLEGRVFDFAAGLSLEERRQLAEGLVRRGPLRQPAAQGTASATDTPRASASALRP